MNITAYQLAERYVGIRELAGEEHHPFIQWCFECCSYDLDTPDEIPWCSVFPNRICWMLRLPRSKSARARSWLEVGTPVPFEEATRGFDIVVLRRGASPTAGHVGFFSAKGTWPDRGIWLLGGNQSNRVSVAQYDVQDILGVRRLV